MTLAVSGGGGGLPDGWWLKCKARPVKWFNEFQNLIQGELAHKFVFIDNRRLSDFSLLNKLYLHGKLPLLLLLSGFIMKWYPYECPKWYGSEQVAFLKIDGTKVKDFSRRYKISSYPKFIALYPNKEGLEFTVFRASPRDYEQFKKWMVGILGDTPTVA